MKVILDVQTLLSNHKIYMEVYITWMQLSMYINVKTGHIGLNVYKHMLGIASTE